VIHAIHIINMFLTPVLNDFSHHDMLYKTTVDFNQLKVFGSICYSSILPTNRKKFDPRASKCVFIGFKTGMKGNVLLNIQSIEIFVSRDVFLFMKIFFHIKRLRILAIKMTVLTFFIKILLPKTNLF